MTDVLDSLYVLECLRVKGIDILPDCGYWHISTEFLRPFYIPRDSSSGNVIKVPPPLCTHLTRGLYQEDYRDGPINLVEIKFSFSESESLQFIGEVVVMTVHRLIPESPCVFSY